MTDLENDVPAEDSIDIALINLIEELVGDEADVDAFDEASDVVLDIIEELESRGEIKEMPDTEATDEEKQTWLDASMVTIQAAMKTALEIVPEAESV